MKIFKKPCGQGVGDGSVLRLTHTTIFKLYNVAEMTKNEAASKGEQLWATFH